MTIQELDEIGYTDYLQNYPIFDESYRETLNEKIKHHYYFREIGFDTPQMFGFQIDDVMAIEMPYFNLLYQQAMQTLPSGAWEIWKDVSHHDIVKTGQKTTDSNATENTSSDQSGTKKEDTTTKSETTQNSDANGNTTGNSFSIHSTLPNGMLSVADIKNNVWASDATKAESTGTSTSHANSDTDNNSTVGMTGNDSKHTNAETENLEHGNETTNNTDTGDITRTRTGYNNLNPAEYMLLIRSTFLNVDKMVIEACSSCFMGVL